ncbi:MAG: nucleotidyltransferase substrate binding protein [Candidatus Gastranaerophilales bacterium]|nr:nucleotidyltransferase substrate binding protein [Candidatus Gastranaerophilales bacterium]
MIISTEYLSKCIKTLEKSYSMLKQSEENSVDYEMYRNSLVKSFEMSIEQSGKLLRKILAPYFGTKKSVDRLSFKDLFRHAHKHSLMNEEEIIRWFKYRDNRNDTTHDYGQSFAEETLVLIEDFLKDVKQLKLLVEKVQND